MGRAVRIACGVWAGYLGKKKHFMSLKLDNERNASTRNSVHGMNKLISEYLRLNGSTTS